MEKYGGFVSILSENNYMYEAIVVEASSEENAVTKAQSKIVSKFNQTYPEQKIKSIGNRIVPLDLINSYVIGVVGAISDVEEGNDLDVQLVYLDEKHARDYVRDDSFLDLAKQLLNDPKYYKHGISLVFLEENQ